MGAEQEVERRSGKLAMLSANMAEGKACLEAVTWCLDQAIGILINATVLTDSLLLVRFLRKDLVPDISDIWLLSTKFSSLSVVKVNRSVIQTAHKLVKATLKGVG